MVGHLPAPLEHASAVSLGGRIYVLGGTAGGAATGRILSFDPSTQAAGRAGTLPGPVANAAAATVGGSAYLVGGLGKGGSPLDSIVRVTLRPVPAPTQSPGTSTTSTTTTTTTTASTTTTAATARRPVFDGHLLIADRGNNRLLVVNARKHIVWRYPGHGRPAPPGGF